MMAGGGEGRGDRIMARVGGEHMMAGVGVGGH